MSPDTDRTTPSDSTKAEDRREAASDHDADRMPTADEEKAAEQHDLERDVAEAHKAANERGAAVEGEGRIER